MPCAKESTAITDLSGMDLEQLRYPVGKPNFPKVIDEVQLDRWINTIADFPEKLSSLVIPFDDGQLDTPYRPGGWTVRQTVHHVGDSHLNSYIRFKWTLTEDKPVIKAYFEDRWADISDSKVGGVAMALEFLKALHVKWAYLLRGLSDAAWDRVFIHPESGQEVPLRRNLGLYAWHCDHHYAHIANLAKREGW